MPMGKVCPLATNILRLQHYLVTVEEASFLDWLIVKQVSFKFKPFFYPQRKIEEEIGIKRTRLETLIKSFSNKGILTAEAKGNKNTKCKITHFHFDFKVFRKFLHDYIDSLDEDYFSEWCDYIDDLIAGKRDTKNTEIDAQGTFDNLQELYNDRIKLYNKKSTSRKKSITSLPTSKRILSQLKKAFSIYEEGLENAFLAFADEYIKGDVKVNNMMNFFLTNKDGDFVIINKYLEEFNANYSYH